MEPRVLRPVPDPLGSYLRPGRRDHKMLLQMLVDGKRVGTGLVADPCLVDWQHDLLGEARRLDVETVLDPRTVDLSTVGGFTRSGVKDLPWASVEPHTPAYLTGASATLMVRQLVSFVQDGGFSAVLAPTHYLQGPGDPWLRIDVGLTRELRGELDARGLGHVLIYYPLVVRSGVLYDADQRDQLMSFLGGLPIDALWLRVHPFGTSSSGPLVLRRYLHACRALHALGVPLVAEHSGTVGVALMAFGAVGGIESGVTTNESVSLSGYLKLPDPTATPFSPSPRIYLHEIAAFLEPKQAGEFFDARGMKSAHGCRTTECCPRGWRDMQLDPRRHFVSQRSREVAALSAVPQTLRAGQYMESFLRPASDRAVRAAEVQPALAAARKRLESWRGTLGADLAEHSAFSVSPPAAGKRLRRSA